MTRTVPGPGCSGPTTERTEERIESRAEERKEATVSQASAASQREFTSASTVEETYKLTQTQRPRWSVGAEGALRFEGAVATIRGRFEVRALGPMWITASADRWSAAAGLRLEF